MAKQKKRGKGKRRKRNSSSKGPPPRPPSTTLGEESSAPQAGCRRAIRIAGWLLGAVGLLASLATLFPSLAGTAEIPLISEDPLSSPFTVKNEGIVPLHHVTAVCVADTVKAANGMSAKGNIIGSPRPRPWLFPGDVVAVSCYDQRWINPQIDFGAPITSAHVTIKLTYSPPWLPFRITRSLGFATVEGQHGALRWVPD